MTEADAIEAVDRPVTVTSLVSDFRDLGIDAGDTLLVHSSLRSLGWVAGGPQAVVDALQTVLTDDGTLVMPTFTGQYTDSATWEHPPVPDEWVQIIRESMPPFRPDVTPTRMMGAIPECFRNYPDVIRSEHPTTSFAAWGAEADDIVGDHGLDYGLGEESPLARIYERDGKVLLLGVGHDNNTSLHLAEYRADFEKDHVQSAAPLLRDGERVVVEYEDIEIDTEDFEAVGADFESQVGLTEGSVGASTAKLVAQPKLVDFAVDWFDANR
ncbi:aminoglycoside N(3)-acetyltransferase [Haloferax profundi]|uniref:Aminoglycoside 3-N-acetyltransferase n=1 Tax=Haloferax profundi TaxID=1544718 RepID=A0A0W1R4J4_9EURY|nr:AAC(3) family N-acetyltransferase [Haloferax profundi]KTG08073.1 aminoglycoside 3-N-acetyltransferase [Haloferax profundi]